MSRYSRQQVLPEVGIHGQKKLSESKILCVGVGGLGSPALLYLAAAGIGKLGIIDGDRVREHNLQRQILFHQKQEGELKTKAAKDQLIKLNPSIEVEEISSFLSPEIAAQMFPEYDLILDGSDNVGTQYLINDAARKFQKPVVFASVTAWDIQITLVTPNAGPCYRCLFPNLTESGTQNCDTTGVMGSVVGIAGTLQATEAIKWLLHPHSSTLKPLNERLLAVDARDMSVFTYRTQPNPECMTCNTPAHLIALKTPIICNSKTDQSSFETLSMKMLQQNKDQYRIIDVRDQEEWDAGHLEGATHLPLSQLLSGVNVNLNQHLEKQIVLYCKSGTRAERAARILSDQGFQNLYILREPIK